jgi:endonuclease G
LDEWIDLPEVSSARRSEMYRDDNDEIVVLPYHHFSIAMNAQRRLAMWTAANIDYNQRFRDDRNRDAFGDDYWIEDPRVPSDLQLKDADFYAPATKVDRGHLVRRQDNAWGQSRTEIEYGNSDTFHWTNCTPQHERFNRGMSGGQWGAFEEHLVDQIAGFGKRISIFAGPVLADDDPGKNYGEGYVQYPVRFWKIIAGVEDGELQAFAFIFDQSEVIRRFGLERFDPGRFIRKQVTLEYVQQQTGVRFPQNLLVADTFAGTPPDRFPEVSPKTIRRHDDGDRNVSPSFDEIL